MELKLYVIPGSHPCVAVEGALALKGLDYERVEMLPGLSPLLQLARFGRRTVPGLKVDGYKVVGSTLIMRTLEGLRPEPPLYPADVGELERWSDDVLQDHARWIAAYALTQRPEAGYSYLADAKVPPLPRPLRAPLTRMVFSAELRLLAGGAGGAERALRDLPANLDRVDALIDDGTIGGERPNALDFEIGSSVRLLLTIEDLREGIDGRPCGELARRLFPRYPGSIPHGALPPQWLPDLAARAADAVPVR